MALVHHTDVKAAEKNTYISKICEINMADS